MVSINLEAMCHGIKHKYEMYIKKILWKSETGQGFSQAASAALGAADIGHWPDLLPQEHFAHSASFHLG